MFFLALFALDVPCFLQGSTGHNSIVADVITCYRRITEGSLVVTLMSQVHDTVWPQQWYWTADSVDVHFSSLAQNTCVDFFISPEVKLGVKPSVIPPIPSFFDSPFLFSLWIAFCFRLNVVQHKICRVLGSGLVNTAVFQSTQQSFISFLCL